MKIIPYWKRKQFPRGLTFHSAQVDSDWLLWANGDHWAVFVCDCGRQRLIGSGPARSVKNAKELAQGFYDALEKDQIKTP